MPSAVSELEPTRDSYRGVVILLASFGLLGGIGAAVIGVMLSNPTLLDVALVLGLMTAAFVGVGLAQIARATRPPMPEAAEVASLGQAASPQAMPRSDGTPEKENSPIAAHSWLASAQVRLAQRLASRLQEVRLLDGLLRGMGAFGMFVASLLATEKFPLERSAALGIVLTTLAALTAAGLAALVARYFSALSPAELPEAPGLAHAVRVVTWLLVLAAAATGLIGLGYPTAARSLHLFVLSIIVAVCCNMALTKRLSNGEMIVFRLNLPVLSVLGSRANMIAGVLDAAERQFGIDLRSTWALTVVRRGVEPLLIALAFLGWLTTSFTVVHLNEEGLVERLGVPRSGRPLQPGLHLHAPWPVDRVFLLPVRQVQALTVGHEDEEEAAGPENVLWAREHAANEYTLLLGNGRDLITVDAAIQFRIRDARAWLYGCQNPAGALRSIAYRAVMRSTVNRTLDQALAENVVALTGRMRAMVQQEADAQGLGVEVMAFTVNGMHPPVRVAAEYQAVGSAELGRVTAAVSAQAYRNETVPAAEAEVARSLNSARAEGANALARAAGEAWSFRTLESQFRTAPKDYVFRRRLETLEKGLADRRLVIVDSRIQRDGGELWLTQ